MATPGVFNDPTINDLTRTQSQAYQEGHDADATATNEKRSAPAVEPSKDLEAPLDKDLEKGESIESRSSVSHHETSREDDVEEAKAADAPTDQTPQDPNIVDWEQPANEDPANPMNWSEKLKWGNIGILAMLSFTT